MKQKTKHSEKGRVRVVPNAHSNQDSVGLISPSSEKPLLEKWKMLVELTPRIVKEYSPEPLLEIIESDLKKTISKVFNKEIYEDTRSLANRKGDEVWINLKQKLEKKIGLKMTS